MCTYDDEGALGKPAELEHALGQYGGWKCCSGEQRADLSLELLALARPPRVALENLTTGCSYKRGVIMSFQLHNVSFDCQLLMRGDKNISFGAVGRHRDCETCKIVSPVPN
jgi:hypothetical protein